MQHKINDEIFSELIKCNRSAFFACTKPNEMVSDNLVKKTIMKMEMAKRIATSHLDNNGTSIVGERIETPDGKLETCCDFQFITNGKLQLFCCFPVEYKLTKYEFHQAAYTYFVAKILNREISQVIAVRFKNNKDKPEDVTEDNFVYSDITKSVKDSKRQNMVLKELDALHLNFRNNSAPRISPNSCCIRPYSCPVKKYCFEKEFGKEENIFDLNDAKFSLRLKLFWKGVVKIEDIPRDFILPERSKRQIKSYEVRKEKIKYDEINERFRIIKEDKQLLFLDVEFFKYINPEYNSLKATSVLPFAFSLIHYDEAIGGNVFSQVLNSPISKTSAEEMVLCLVNYIYNYPKLNIVVYNKNKIVNALNRLFAEDSEEHYYLNLISNRMWDLGEVILNREYYHPIFKGSNYLKDICKVTAPGVYLETDLIANGVQAENYFKVNSSVEGCLSEASANEIRSYVTKDARAILETFIFLKGKLFNYKYEKRNY